MNLIPQCIIVDPTAALSLSNLTFNEICIAGLAAKDILGIFGVNLTRHPVHLPARAVAPKLKRQPWTAP